MTQAVQEFRVIAWDFIHSKLPFFVREWRDKLADELSHVIEDTVEAHTSDVSNTALRDALKHNETMAQHALSHLPYGTKKCRCKELDDGEHKPQPICHYCAIGAIERRAHHALKSTEALEGKKTA